MPPYLNTTGFFSRIIVINLIYGKTSRRIACYKWPRDVTRLLEILCKHDNLCTSKLLDSMQLVSIIRYLHSPLCQVLFQCVLHFHLGSYSYINEKRESRHFFAKGSSTKNLSTPISSITFTQTNSGLRYFVNPAGWLFDPQFPQAGS